jgi:hypothetical protein
VDQPVTLQAGLGRSGHRVYIHRRRLEKVSPWFSHNAPNNKILKLEDVSAQTLQTFYSWIYGEEEILDTIEEVEEAVEASEAIGVATAKDSDALSHEEDGQAAEEDSSSIAVPSPTIKKENVNTDGEQGEEEGAGEDEGGVEESETANTSPRTANDEETPWYMGPENDSRTRVFGRLLDVYIFSIDYEITGLKLDSLLAWQRFYDACYLTLNNRVTHNTYKRISSSSGFAKFLFHCYAFDSASETQLRANLSLLPSEFVAEVAILALDLAKHNKPYSLMTRYRWCDFHEHETEQEKINCQSHPSRQQDVDMVYMAKKAKAKAEPQRPAPSHSGGGRPNAAYSKKTSNSAQPSRNRG